MKQIRRKKRRGFTLLEVLLVLVILGVIAAVVVPGLLGRQEKAMIDATRLSIKGLEHILELYALEHDAEYIQGNQDAIAMLLDPAQLVIQASALAKGGEVLVLDMGKPVKIKDLAQRMISLMGLTVRSERNPEGDIAIEYIGLRPAEKLFEELLIGSKVEGTEHPRIMTADEDSLPYAELSIFIEQLKEAATGLDYETARQLLIDVVKEYAPPNGIDDLAWNQAKKMIGGSEPDTIIKFPTQLT